MKIDSLIARRPNIKKNSAPNKSGTAKKPDDYEPKEEYDLSKLTILPKGRFDPKRRLGNNGIELEPDMAKAFPNDESVNEIRTGMNPRTIFSPAKAG
jgi:hypothetical protein